MKSPFHPVGECFVLFCFVFQNALTLFLKEAPISIITLGRHFFWEHPTPRALPYTYRPFFILKDLPLSIIHGTISMDVLYESSHGVSLSSTPPLPRKKEREGETNL
jgi:hypothetical protein